MGCPPALVRVAPLFGRTFLVISTVLFLTAEAGSESRPSLTDVEISRDDAEVRILAKLEGGSPAATQVRFTGGGRIMVLEIAGVDNKMDRRNISLRDDRLNLITVESLPGGVQISFEAGDTPEPFSGHLLEPVITPAGLMMTIWKEGATTIAPLPPGGRPYEISELVLIYAKDHPDNPPIAEIRDTTEVALGLGPDGFVSPEPGMELQTFKLSNVPAASRFRSSAVRRISEAIVQTFNDRGIAGVYVEPDPEDIDPASSRDLRQDRTTLRLRIWTGRLLEFRTFASGTRVSEDESVDNPVHARIKTESPVQPGDLLLKTEIDEYVDRLNRHPGRAIDTALSRAGEPGGAYLDYLVNDKRPWSAYAQVSNTGNEGTGSARERFGFTHNQLTNRDDILQLDYITGNFEDIHAFFGSYDAPLVWDNRVRAIANGSYVEYDSRQLGQTVQFQGDQWSFGGELRGMVWQQDTWFVDAFGGVRWRNITVDNNVVGFPQSGDEDFFLPEIGIALEHRTAPFTVRAELSNTWNVSQVGGNTDGGLRDLGSQEVNTADFEILRWNAQASAYLDALLADPDSPTGIPLIHEFFVATRGQFAWDNRLAPQFQDVSTGYYAVRGYPQSITAGDDVILGRAEYRFHLPRLLPVDLTPIELPWGRTFSLQPTQSNGIPDWDLVLRGFFDIGWTATNDSAAGEYNDRLMGAGVGMELRILEHFVFNADYGVALEDTGDGQAERGDDEFHLVGTIAF